MLESSGQLSTGTTTMPRKAAVNPSIRLNTALPPEIAMKLQLFLFSEVEGRVPQGAYQEFLTARIQEFFGGKILDLSEWTGQPPCTNLVKGNQQTIELLTALLKGESK